MANSNWGECKACRHFEVEPGVAPEPNTMGLCIVHEHEVHKLRVSGACGCSQFNEGDAAHAEGASEAPPHGAR